MPLNAYGPEAGARLCNAIRKMLERHMPPNQGRKSQSALNADKHLGQHRSQLPDRYDSNSDRGLPEKHGDIKIGEATMVKSSVRPSLSHKKAKSIDFVPTKFGSQAGLQNTSQKSASQFSEHERRDLSNGVRDPASLFGLPSRYVHDRPRSALHNVSVFGTESQTMSSTEHKYQDKSPELSPMQSRLSWVPSLATLDNFTYKVVRLSAEMTPAAIKDNLLQTFGLADCHIYPSVYVKPHTAPQLSCSQS